MSKNKINIEEGLLKEKKEYFQDDELIDKESDFISEWEKRTKHICKPCWELKYCPYGLLVENFSSLVPTREEAIEHNEFLKKKLKEGVYDGRRKKIFEEEVKNFDPDNYPKEHNQEEIEKSCSIFGHQCPVFVVNEPMTETLKNRRISRHIPRETMLRVVRRDNSTCQICGKHLMDKEIEFDHIIPFSKGGSTEESNLQVTCSYCNRSKGSKVPDEIHADQI